METQVQNDSAGQRLLIVLLPVLLVVTGCAAGRDVMDVRVPNVPQNPTGGKAVRVAQVRDCRVFEAKPTTHSTPSLKNAKQITDKAITIRAIARKSGGYGNRMGDIVLPEGRSVEALVEEAVVRGFRESGYRVLSKGDPDYETAIPIEVDIEKFWTWFNPGFWTIRLEFESRLKLKGDLPPLRSNSYLFVEAGHNAGAATRSAWMETWRRGLEEIVKKLRETLTSPTNPRAS